MGTITDIWAFFVTTSDWFLGLWTGWFGFFKGIIPWYLNLSIGWQITIGVFYMVIGLLMVKSGGWLQYDAKSKSNRVVKAIQNVLYNLFVAFFLPAGVIVSTAIGFPLMLGILFYGIWLIVWCAVLLLTFLYVCTIGLVKSIFS